MAMDVGSIKRRPESRHQRDAARRRHAGAAHHHDADCADAAEGRAVTLPRPTTPSDKPDTQDQTVVAIDSREPVLGQRRCQVDEGGLAASRLKTVLEDKTEKIV